MLTSNSVGSRGDFGVRCEGISPRRIIESGKAASVIYNALLFHFYTCLGVSPFPIARIIPYRSESPCNPAIGLSRGTVNEIE